jgi:hypothetical protein
VSTVGDELKLANGRSKVIGISLKDRSAILPAGHMADTALWFHEQAGNFVSSTYYGPDLPGWAAAFNQSRDADRFAGGEWTPLGSSKGKPFLKMADKPGAAYWRELERTPWGNEMLAAMARRAVEAEKLGKRDATDLLAISFSANDYIGHDHGPDSPQVHDISVRTDRLLGEFFDFLDKQVGMKNVLVVLTADHGAAPVPEVMREHRMPGGRIMTADAVRALVQKRLEELYGEGKWVLGYTGPAPYLNSTLIAEKNLDLAEVRRRAAEAVRAIPHILRVYTPEQLARGETLDDQIDRRVRNGFFAKRSSDLFIVAQPYWIFERTGTGHGTPHNYDAHVPVILMGPGIRPGQYARRVMVNDIAPTLATLLEVETPSGSMGTVLEEAAKVLRQGQ